MKQRLLLCLLLCGVMLYYAVPRLSLESGGLESLFAGSWLLFALLAVAGNLTGILYSPKKHKVKRKMEYKRLRQY
ncbi:hypothetical protein ACWF7H_03820 [Peribacillus butanolivorans]|uniref:Uncharacterized protein n=2 Tax=Peribacillus butanolivorans TaxID=421767 RepID=A0AAX0S5A6_9BACI|nr:hypothetical protein [Peribacillus butanolivorans]AXN37862.1 hypothetical protein DTO10_05130 [Peribacillus butanolivorans]MCO0597175.1 hypothetical protein [Peribacillus butanolivorans]MED3687612.1 hypothetical protein [Peribacillus butanolivorans]PEJ34500.1 hypothetical protein CN689_10250 [Peribacillus butanolivorans]